MSKISSSSCPSKIVFHCKAFVSRLLQLEEVRRPCTHSSWDINNCKLFDRSIILDLWPGSLEWIIAKIRFLQLRYARERIWTSHSRGVPNYRRPKTTAPHALQLIETSRKIKRPGSVILYPGILDKNVSNITWILDPKFVNQNFGHKISGLLHLFCFCKPAPWNAAPFILTCRSSALVWKSTHSALSDVLDDKYSSTISRQLLAFAPVHTVSCYVIWTLVLFLFIWGQSCEMSQIWQIYLCKIIERLG